MSSAPASPADPFEELRTQLRGELVRPDDPSFDTLRKLWNGSIDRRPTAIVRCRDVGDVGATVRFGRNHRLRTTVRAGGHGIAGSALADGGLVIDLSGMRGVEVDPTTRTVVAQGGALWGDVDHATQYFGLAVPGGFVSTTGVGGFTLGGGIAWTSRKLGLACDRLIGAEVVTATGEVVRTDAQQHPELLWALRGGGGNFGVVTSFRFRAEPVGPLVFGGFRMFTADRAREILRLTADLYGRSPEELNILTALTHAPPAPFVPPAFHGKPVVIVALCYFGPPEKGPTVARDLLALRDPVTEAVGPVPYLQLQASFDPLNPPGDRNYWKSLFVERLTDPALDVLLERFAKVPSPLTELHFQYFGGAVSRVGELESAIGNRSVPFLFNFIGKWKDAAENERNVAFVRELWEALRPHSTGGVYLNFLADQSSEMTRASYDERILARLASVKRQYDPEDFFHGSHEIPLSSA